MRQTVTRQPERHDMTCAGMLYALLVSNDDEARQQIWR